MTNKEKKNKIAEILLDFYDEHSSNEINRPMIPSIYAGKILDLLKEEESVSKGLEKEVLHGKRCSKCGAFMKADTSVVYTSNPPMYMYHCPKCGSNEYGLCSENY